MNVDMHFDAFANVDSFSAPNPRFSFLLPNFTLLFHWFALPSSLFIFMGCEPVDFTTQNKRHTCIWLAFFIASNLFFFRCWHFLKLLIYRKYSKSQYPKRETVCCYLYLWSHVHFVFDTQNHRCWTLLRRICSNFLSLVCRCRWSWWGTSATWRMSVWWGRSRARTWPDSGTTVPF